MYCIIRLYQRNDIDERVIKRGLTLEQAKAHCRDAEACSGTCTLPENKAHTETFGDWFDGFEDE